MRHQQGADHADWETQGRALRRELAAMEELVQEAHIEPRLPDPNPNPNSRWEAHIEPRFMPNTPDHVAHFPLRDYTNTLGTLQELWQCVQQMHCCMPTEGFQEPELEALFLEYHPYSEALVRHTVECVGHSAQILAVDGCESHVLPQALFQLYAESQIFTSKLDQIWKGYLLKRSSHLKTAIDSNPQATLDFLALASILSQLRVLSNHASSLAWRVAHILQKEQPHKALLPEPEDLYKFDIQT